MCPLKVQSMKVTAAFATDPVEQRTANQREELFVDTAEIFNNV